MSDQEIITMLKSRNVRGLQILYRQYSSLLYGLICRIVKLEDLAENVLQDVFLKVWKNIDSYHPSKGRFMAWVVNIARNSAIDCLRSKIQKQNSRTKNADIVLAMDERYAEEIKINDIGIRDIVGKLKPKYKEIIELIYFCGYTQAETAKALSIPLGTVKSRVKKAFQDLRILLD